MINQNTIQRSAQDLQRRQEKAFTDLKEQQATRQGKDPYRPWHPVLNPEAPPEPTLGGYLKRQQEEKKAKAEKMKGYQRNYQKRIDNLPRHEWETICRMNELTVDILVYMVKAGCFRSRFALASQLKRSGFYGQAFGCFLEREGILTPGEFDACFRVKRVKARATTNQEKRHTWAMNTAV